MRKPTFLYWPRLVVLIVSTLTLPVAGCGDVEWNWDSTWWQRPKRVVKPTSARTQSAPEGRAAPSEDGDRASDQEPSPRTTAVQDHRVPDESAWTDASSRSASRPPRTTSKALPFYQLYLLQAEGRSAHPMKSAPPDHEPEAQDAETEAAGGHRGEYVQELQQASAPACAALLEMLYVPAGRSGSAAECYLLYENYAEFEAAVSFAANLDVAVSSEAPAGVGAMAAFDAGVAKYLQIIEAGAIVEPALVDAAERGLAEAAQSSGLPPPIRWAAAILAGRLASDYRYDYAAARSFYRQAERAAAAKSLENMVARWWQADAFLQEDRGGDADEIYRALLADYEQTWKEAHIVHRCRAAVRQRRK